MLDRVIPDLRIHSIPTGSHGTGWDLTRYLYRGTSMENRSRALDERIAHGEFGIPRMERLELLIAIHEQLESHTASVATRESLLAKFRTFMSWVDAKEEYPCLTVSTAKAIYFSWADHLEHRVRVVKDLKRSTAYNCVVGVAAVLGPALNLGVPRASEALVRLAGVRRLQASRRSRGLQADKQRLDHTFQFGHFLADLCDALTVEQIRGPFPLVIPAGEDGQTLLMGAGRVSPDLNPEQLPNNYRRERALTSRASLPPGADPTKQKNRVAVINARINVEMLIFIAQTGMNLSQAKDEPLSEYRWQTDDQDYIVRAVYKGRRQGVARFVVFRAYRDHFKRYLDWLDALGLNDGDDRLFPTIHLSRVPPAHGSPKFSVLRSYCTKIKIPFVSPQKLRNTRVNWLLRRSRDPELTAEMDAHTVETLLRVYEEGDLQSASQEIGKYLAKTDPTLTKSPRTIPVCLKGDDGPRPLPDIPKEAPPPDCVTPEGCLWCLHFRDVLAPDYCWRLASHRYAKSLEIALFHPPASQPLHPGYLVIDRLSAKLKAIAARSDICAGWVMEAKERIREGDYHPRWAGLIENMGDLT